MKKKFIVCRGLSFSGKSTWAREKAKELGNTVVITKDDIRAEMGVIVGDPKTKVKESKVIAKRDEMILKALEKGQNIISADVNISTKVDHIKNMKALVFPKYRDQYDFEIKDFTDVPVETLLERAEKTDRPEGAEFWKKIIMEQKNKFLIPKKLYEDCNYWYNSLPKAVILDMDGSLAIHNGRKPFDYAKCVEDLPNVPLVEIAQMYCNRDDVKVIILSGRPDTYRKETENWLLANNIIFDELFMRDPNRVNEKGGMVSDVIIKDEIYKAEIEGKYLVHAVFDDRKKVVEGVWVKYGLPVFAFGNPYHDF